MNSFQFCENETTTIARNNRIERYCVGFEIFLVMLGQYFAHNIPNTIGTPKRSRICSSIGKNGITNVGILLFIAIIWLYIDPQKKKLNGVTRGAKAVVIAVSETDSSMFPLDREDMKFEMFPPGQDATSIIPSATIGVMNGESASATAKVTAGSPTH